MALNHRVAKLEVTDGYIRKDWSIVDRTIQKVMERVMKIQ